MVITDKNKKNLPLDVNQGGQNEQSITNMTLSGKTPTPPTPNAQLQSGVGSNAMQSVVQKELIPQNPNWAKDRNSVFETNPVLAKNVLPILNNTTSYMNVGAGDIANNPYLKNLFNMSPQTHNATNYSKAWQSDNLGDFASTVIQDLTDEKNVKLQNQAMYKNADNYLGLLSENNKLNQSQLKREPNEIEIATYELRKQQAENAQKTNEDKALAAQNAQRDSRIKQLENIGSLYQNYDKLSPEEQIIANNHFVNTGKFLPITVSSNWGIKNYSLEQTQQPTQQNSNQTQQPAQQQPAQTVEWNGKTLHVVGGIAYDENGKPLGRWVIGDE